MQHSLYLLANSYYAILFLPWALAIQVSQFYTEQCKEKKHSISQALTLRRCRQSGTTAASVRMTSSVVDRSWEGSLAWLFRATVYRGRIKANGNLAGRPGRELALTGAGSALRSCHRGHPVGPTLNALAAILTTVGGMPDSWVLETPQALSNEWLHVNYFLSPSPRPDYEQGDGEVELSGSSCVVW
jgi:hypothetical protein